MNTYLISGAVVLGLVTSLLGFGLHTSNTETVDEALGALRVTTIPQGGTGTSTAPPLNYILIGDGSGQYILDDIANYASVGGGGGGGMTVYFQNGGATLNVATTTVNFTPNSFSVTESPADTLTIRIATTTLGLLTTNVGEGSNLYYTDARVSTYMSASSTYTNLQSFYTTPSGRITAGDGLTWSSNTLNFDGGNTPAGALGGTWASPTVDNDGHSHTGATLSGIDISDDTNLTVTATGLQLSADAVALASGYLIPLSASTTNWNGFYDTPSTRITAGTNLSWDGNTLNASGGGGGDSVWATSSNSLAIYPVDTSDVVLIGTNATSSDNTDRKLEVHGDATFLETDVALTSGLPATQPLTIISTNGNSAGFIRANNSAAAGPTIIGYRGGGSVTSGVTTALTDYELLEVTGRGYDGSAWSNSQGSVSINAAEDWDGSGHGTYISFNTTPIGQTTQAEVGRVANDGSFLIGTTSPTHLLTVNGDIGTANITATGTASSSALVVSNSINLFGGGAKTTANDLCIQLTGSAALCDGTDATGAGGSGISTSSIPVAGNLAYWTSASALSDVATGTLSESVAGLELSASRSLIGGAAALSLTSGYNIPLTASTTNWNTAFDWGNHATQGYLTTVDISANTNLSADGTEIILTGDALSLGTALTFTTGTSTTSFFSGLGTFTNMVVNTLATFLNVVVTGLLDVGGGVLEIPNGTAPTADDVGELAHDTSDNQLILDDFVIGKATERIWGVTVASTSPYFINATNMAIPTQLDGYTMTAIRCHVVSGTSKAIIITDGTNATESITCGTTVTSDDGSITNAAVTAGELMYIDFGSTSGAVDTVSVSVFGQWVRE